MNSGKERANGYFVKEGLDRHGTMIEAGGIQQEDHWIRLIGEFDVCDLEALRTALNLVRHLARPTLVDLSHVTFLDASCAMELVTSHLLRPELVRLVEPSWQVLSTAVACGLEEHIEQTA